MNVLIAVLSCHTLRHYEQSIRETWAQELPHEADLRFFIGKPQSGIRVVDEIFLNCPDEFSGITEKTVALYKWALDQGYDFVWKVDLDTLVRPKLLLNSGLEQYDWVGGQNSFFASGGAGYGLSKRSMEYVVEAGGAPGFEEDVHIAHILLRHGIELHSDPRFVFIPGAIMNDATITYHLSSVREWYYKGYKPEMMHETWADQKNKNYRSYAVPAALVGERRLFRRK
jgi:hypothetical protein